MLKRLVVGFLAFASAAHSEDSSPTIGPVLVGDEARSECQAALGMASAAFRSTSPVLTWPVPGPDAGLAALVLRRKDRDISGGDGIWVDPEVFARMEGDERLRMVFHWQREVRDGRRILVVEVPHSWRGSWYSLFLVDGALSPESFPQIYRDAAQAYFRQPKDGPPVLLPVLYQNSWATPMILRDESSGGLWVLEQGQFNFWQPEWQIHVNGAEGFSPLCRVIFNPDDSTGLERMPPAVRDFATFADAALGPDPDLGTLRPTQGIRNRVSLFWTILAERPWALTATPYNSREEVEAGLTAWAEGVPARVRLLQNLFESLEPAENALTHLLRDRFPIDEDAARTFSAYAIDHMLRSYFTFHSEVGGLSHTPSLTPWPNSLH